MCGRACKPVLRYPRTVRIPFATNQNLSFFCANTKGTGCAKCPFQTPGVLCSPQVCRKLINRAPNTHCTQTEQCKRHALVYKVLEWYKIYLEQQGNYIENYGYRQCCKYISFVIFAPFFFFLGGVKITFWTFRLFFDIIRIFLQCSALVSLLSHSSAL